MLLSDKDIKTRIKQKTLIIKPFNPKNLGPSSYDLHLGNRIRVFKPTIHPCIDVKNYKDELQYRYKYKEKTVEHYIFSDVVISDNPFILHPQEFILCATKEYIELPKNLASQIMGRSSTGRIGVIVHATAGFIDPGFSGNLTLEVANLGRISVKLYPGMKIAQLAFYELKSPCEVSYQERKSSKYIKEKGATESRIIKDFER